MAFFHFSGFNPAQPAILSKHQTRAELSPGSALATLFDEYRDRHFTQGFVPALIAREIFLRRSPLVRGKWLFFIVAAVCLAVSACYEFVEWWAAVLGGSAAQDFLGTQGDVWDTQWDMFMALVGAVTAQLLLAREQDRELARLESAHPRQVGAA